MLLRVICSSPLAAALPAVCVPGLSRLLRAPALSPRNYHVYPAVNDPSPINVLLDPLEGSDQHVAMDFQHNKVSRELLRYSTHFPDALYGHLAGLVASRPFPTAVDLSCVPVRPAATELGRRGFRVAQACPPGGSARCLARLACGSGDVVALLPGPRDLHAPELLAEARRLMAQGGYLAVAWNDRDLSSPFVSDLESLLEQLNPHYCRSSRQHTPPAVLAALSDGGALALHSFSTWPHSLAMARAGVLQDLLGGFAVVRPYLAASSSHRKAFHQAVRELVRRHFGDDESPFELPLTTKLYVMAPSHTDSASSTAVEQAARGTRSISSSSSSRGCEAGGEGSSECGCECGPDDGCMTHHTRTRRSGLSSRDSCTPRHLYA